MKRIVLPVLLMLLIVSCGKWEKNTKLYTYYSEDYIESDIDVLDINTSEIEALYLEMYNKVEDKNDYPETYKLHVKSNGVEYTEVGTIDSDWKTSISFNPENGTSYTGIFQEDKGTYKLPYEVDNRVEEFTFVWKKKCKQYLPE